MRKDAFYRESSILIFSNIGTGILGFMFSIILSKILGAEGVGLYGLIMPIYNLVICLICGGIIAALSKTSAYYFVNNDYKNIKKTVKISVSFDLVWSVSIVAIFFFLAPLVGEHIVKDPRSQYALKIICPAMIFIAISNILKGFFYGTSKTIVPALIDVGEKFIRISFFIFILNVTKAKTVEECVSLAYLTLCIGELISLALLYIFYKIFTKDKNESPKEESYSKLLKDVLMISLPLCAYSFLTTGIGTISSLIVPRRLIAAGFTYKESLALLGKFSGMSLTIALFPMIVISAFSTILIPNLSQMIASKEYDYIKERTGEVLHISLLVGLATSVICTLVPSYLGWLFYKSQDITSYIQFASFIAPFIYISVTTQSILNGLGKSSILLRNSVLCSIIELALIYVLSSIKIINVYGIGIAAILSNIILIALNYYEIKKAIIPNFNFYDIIVSFLLSILTYFILRGVIYNASSLNFYIKTFLPILLSFVVILFGGIKLSSNRTK
ncbi:MAG: stage V sporulation protein B [Oscillospiraceae bacterium]|nr:stage V sporulation protein B [Oscillospiraceae bacterium]